MLETLKKNKFKVAVIILLIARKSYPALILAYIMLYGIGAHGLDILFGYSGQISMGHAGFFAIGAYTSAILSRTFGINPFLTMLAGCVMAVLIGFLIAIPATKLVKHFLSFLTIAFGQVIYLFVNSCIPLTGGAGGYTEVPKLSLFGFVFDNNTKYYALTLVLLIIVVILKKNLINSRMGMAFIAIRENVKAAEGMGINVRAYKAYAFAISACLMGLAGGLYAHLVGYISPETFNSTASVLFMTMILFGGIGTTMGPLVGSGLLMLIKEVFQFLQIYQVLIYGVFILIVLFFMPSGAVGLFNKVTKKIQKKFGKKEQEYADA